jgi:hypothetical protein
MAATRRAADNTNNVEDLDARREANKEFFQFRDSWLAGVTLDQELSPVTVRVALWLALAVMWLSKETMVMWPGIDSIRNGRFKDGELKFAGLGLSRHTIQRALGQLVSRDHLVIVRHGKGGLKASTHYRPGLPPPQPNAPQNCDTTPPNVLQNCDSLESQNCGGSPSEDKPSEGIPSDYRGVGTDPHDRSHERSDEGKRAKQGKPTEGPSSPLSIDNLWALYPRRAPSASRVRAARAWDELTEADRKIAIRRLPSYRQQLNLERSAHCQSVHPHSYLAERHFDELPDPDVPIDWKRVDAQILTTLKSVLAGEHDGGLRQAYEAVGDCLCVALGSNHTKARRVSLRLVELLNAISQRSSRKAAAA